MPIINFILESKTFLEVTFRLARDALHVHIGLVLFLGIALAFASHPRRFRIALGWLFVLSLLNEAMDWYSVWSRGLPWYWPGSLKDMVNTLFWPAVIVYGGPAIVRLLGFELRIRSPRLASPTVSAATSVATPPTTTPGNGHVR